MFDRRGCVLALGGFVLVTGAGGGLAFLALLPLGHAFRDHLPPEPLAAGLVCLWFPLWALFSFAASLALSLALDCREAARRRAFEGRPPLEEAFARLFPGALAGVAAQVRAELERFIGRPEVTRRLLPADLIRATGELVGYFPDDLDWAEFLFALEGHFGARLPNHFDREATVEELVTACAAGRRACP